MNGSIVNSYGSFAVGLTSWDKGDLEKVADKGYEVLARSNGVQIARCNTFNKAVGVLSDIGVTEYHTS